jgi:GT2 family glycosyltransferase
MTSAGSPRISIVIVTYKSRDFIDRCLAPFRDRPDLEVVVWENASGDGVIDHVRAEFPFVTVIDSDENLGFSRGNNRAFVHCRGQYVLLLNPDAFVDHAGVVDSLADYLDAHPDVAACGPRLVHADGRHQVGDTGWRISLGSILVHSFMLQRVFPWARGLFLTHSSLLKRAEVPVDFICGACMMVRREVIAAVGGLDESVFMYGEDIEWGTRIRDAGWNITYLPQISVLHLQGATQKGGQQAFSSTKWLDDIAVRSAPQNGALGYGAIKAALFAGFCLRAVVLMGAGTVLRRPRLREQARIMARYAGHALSLPRRADLLKRPPPAAAWGSR